MADVRTEGSVLKRGMVWFLFLALLSLLLVLAGGLLAFRRIRQYREEEEARRRRALAEMTRLAQRQPPADGG